MKMVIRTTERNKLHDFAVVDLHPENDADQQVLAQLKEMSLLAHCDILSERFEEATITLHHGHGKNNKSICQCE